MRFRKTYLYIGILAALFFLKACFLAFYVTPLWDTPDETGHYAYARDIATGKGVPLLGKAEIGADIMRHASRAPDARSQLNWIAQHPPVYYTLAALPLKIGAYFTGNPEILFRLPRLISALCGALALVVLYRTAILLNLDTISALALSSFIGFTPMYSHLSSGTNNDIALFLFATLATFYWTRYMLERRIGDATWLVFWLSVAAATKLTGLVLLAPMVGTVLLELDAPWKQRIRQAFGLCALALFLPGLWLVRNYVYFDNPFATALAISSPLLSEPLQDSFFVYLARLPAIEHFTLNFYGLIGWIGTGAGSLSWFQIHGVPRLVFSLTEMGIAIILFAYFVINFYPGMGSERVPRAEAKNFSIIHSLTNRFKNATRTVFLLLLAVSVFCGIAFFINCYNPATIDGRMREASASIVCAVFILSTQVFMVEMKSESRIACYASLMFGFFSFVLLYNVYEIYLSDGRMRATHGRYLYPVIPLMLICLTGIAAKRLRVPRWLFVLAAAALAYCELAAYLDQIIPFYGKAAP